MQWYEGTSKKLEVGYRYSHQDLIRLLKSDYPQMSESSYHWAVCGMLKSGNLTKVARNVYVVQNERMTIRLPKGVKATRSMTMW